MVKKMVEFNPKELKYVFYGESNRKGIFMRLEQSEEHLGKNFKTSSVFRFPSVYAHLLDDGKIACNSEKTDEIWMKMQEQQEEDGEKAYKLNIVLSVLSLISFAMMFVTIFQNNAYLPCLCVSIGLILQGLSKLSCIIYYQFKAITGDETVKQLFRFHAAEHAAINAFYDLKRTPTLEEIKEYSNYSYRCSTTLWAREAWIFLILGVCRLAPGPWFFLAIFLTMPLTFWAAKNYFYFAEVFMLAEPTELEYKVAIEAMSVVVWVQEKVQESMGDFLDNLTGFAIVMEEGDDSDSITTLCIRIGNPDDLENE